MKNFFVLFTVAAFPVVIYAQGLPPPPPPFGDQNPPVAQIVFAADLMFGMTGSDVFALQRALQAKGYFSPEHVPTNYFGVKTHSAVIALQRAHGLPATGFVGPMTRAVLNGQTPQPDTGGVFLIANMGVGSSGSQVRALQNKLMALGYFSGEATGYFGVKTRAAVIAYQQARGIPATGYVGPLTRASFAPIPPPHPYPIPPTQGTEEQITMREGQREGPFLLEKVYANYVTGKNFLEYPVPRDEGFPITLRVGEIASNGCTITLKLVRIESGNLDGPTATFIKKTNPFAPCPICLSGATHIDTPTGQVLVKDIKEGMLVWSTDEHGSKVPVPVLQVSKVPVPDTHQMISLQLQDGRSLLVSPGHPTADGRRIGDLAMGDMLDGSYVVSALRVSYSEGFTYDILPESTTGTYWAQSILIGSTLQ